MILSQAIGEFLVARRVDGLAAKTISTYRDILKQFDALFGHQHTTDITTKMIRDYITNLMDSDRSEETVKSMTRTLHVFWRWAATEYTIPDPMKNIKYPRKPKQRDVPHLTCFQLERLFQAARQTSNPERDSLMLWLLLDTGIRREGCAALKWKNINLDERTLYVVEKGRKGRTVAFSVGTRYLLRKWQYYHGRRDHVFCGIGDNPLTGNGVYQVIKRVGEAAGIPAFPHMLRHNFAMNWMANGGEITALQKQMGHSRIDTTIQYYLRFAPSVLVAAHKAIPVSLNVIRG